MIDGLIAVSLADLVRMPQFKEFYNNETGKQIGFKITQEQLEVRKEKGLMSLQIGDDWYAINRIPNDNLVDKFLFMYADALEGTTQLVRDEEDYNRVVLKQRTLDGLVVECQRWCAASNKYNNLFKDSKEFR